MSSLYVDPEILERNAKQAMRTHFIDDITGKLKLANIGPAQRLILVSSQFAEVARANGEVVTDVDYVGDVWSPKKNASTLARDPNVQALLKEVEEVPFRERSYSEIASAHVNRQMNEHFDALRKKNPKNLTLEALDKAVSDWTTDSHGMPRLDEDGFEREPNVFEWWSVSGPLAQKLQRGGEIVAKTEYGPVWGRQTTGMNVLYDPAVEKAVLAVWRDAVFPETLRKNRELYQKLEDACRAGDIDSVRECLRAGADLESANRCYLRFAAESGNAALFKYLIEESEADTGKKLKFDDSYRLEQRDDPEEFTRARRVSVVSLFDATIKSGSVECLKLAVRDWLKPPIDNSYLLPLRRLASDVVESGKLDLVKYIIEEAAKMSGFNLINCDNVDCYRRAIEKGHLDVLKYLLDDAPKFFDAAPDTEVYLSALESASRAFVMRGNGQRYNAAAELFLERGVPMSEAGLYNIEDRDGKTRTIDKIGLELYGVDRNDFPLRKDFEQACDNAGPRNLKIKRLLEASAIPLSEDEKRDFYLNPMCRSAVNSGLVSDLEGLRKLSGSRLEAVQSVRSRRI